jgi:hypothetical protein
VADQAISPYSSTNKCMASILNLNQSDDLDRFENNFGVHELIHSNVVTKSLEELGYEIKNYSLFDIGEQPKYYSLLPSCGVAFIDGVMKNSILGMGLRYYQEQKFYDLHADILNKMPVSSDKPTFFYAHILAPHPPFVIDSAGNNIRFFGQRHRISTNSYTEQLQGLNGMVLESVQRILEESPKSMVIIMGDHGYRFIDKQEAFTVFLAYKGPNSKDITALKYSSEIFKLVMKEFSAGIN